METIAVLIPCYNEARTIRKVVRDYQRALPDASIYVYDNASEDETARVAEEAGAIVRRVAQRGKGNVLRRMFREIDAQCYILVDGDDTYPAENAQEMVDLVIEEQADMVIGDRLSSTYMSENKRPFHSMGNLLVRKLINGLFQTDIKDIMTGYRAMSYSFVKTFPVLSKGFEIETEMSIHAADKNMDVRSVVVDYRDRPEGSESKLRTYSDGLRVLRMILRLLRNYRPMFFFGWLAVLLSLVSTVFLIPVLAGYFSTGLVERFPTLIVCGFTYVAAILSLFSGTILETQNWKNRQDFETRLSEVCNQYAQWQRIQY